MGSDTGKKLNVVKAVDCGCRIASCAVLLFMVVLLIVSRSPFEEKLPDGTFRPVVSNKSDEKKEMLAFVERWIRLYRGEGRKWLAHGRELHPPKIDCESVAYHENFRGTEIDNVKPVVFGTAWEAADGTRALMFANATAYEQKIAYRWKGTWTRTTMQPHELRLVPVAK